MMKKASAILVTAADTLAAIDAGVAAALREIEAESDELGLRRTARTSRQTP